MAFDITATPTLQAVATPDQRVLASDLRQRVEEALREAERDPAAEETREALDAAQAALGRLQASARALTGHARRLRQQTAAGAAKAVEKLIESAGAGDKPDESQAATVAALEHRERLTARAIERLVEHLIPRAQIERLRRQSQALAARAKAIEHAAQERAEKVLSQLRDAVSDEVVLPVDLSKGVAGALLTQAAELKRLAQEADNQARQIERAYVERNGGDQP